MSLSELVDRLSQTRVLVVGDLILDHYIHGTTERTSPEAPVPVVLYDGEVKTPGGAANVARNIAVTGAHAVCIGVVGADPEGQIVTQSLHDQGIDCSGTVIVSKRPTTTKMRIISQSQQMLRLDREETSLVSDEVQAQLIRNILKAMPSVQAVIVSDYAKGVLAPAVLRAVIDEAQRASVPLFVDPKGRDYSRYSGVFCLTPNAREAFDATGVKVTTLEGLSEAANIILETTGARQLVVTRGGEGVVLFQPHAAPEFIRAAAREVFDVTGAGDTFIAFLAMSEAANASPVDAARLTNAAAGVAVAKTGAATVSLTELRNALSPGARARKRREPAQLEQLGNDLRAAGKKIVFANGCFDFIHVGHVAFFQQARALGDVLVVATNADDMITRLKGAPRPIIRQDQREELLASIEAVDYIVPFADETPHELIRALKPDLLVKGSNYSREQVEGYEIVEQYGGKIVLLDVIANISTQDLIGKTRG